ncbi:hypothetical protein QR685DRAFT_450497 [Neurospora intermedia]|uniref:Cell wall protein YJL171C/Tos1 N-terminal domain-containing protein n=1 Tax=Neurospora intermedia TaxID=5142 RepID=A0ABR3D1I5_NEUIN
MKSMASFIMALVALLFFTASVNSVAINNTLSFISHSGLAARMQTGSQDLCQGHDTDENGNHFCQNVQQVVYTNVNTPPGQYKAVTSMNKDTKRCDMAFRNFGGDLAPFNEPVSYPPPPSQSHSLYLY